MRNTGKKRKLTSDEITMARKIFGDTIDYGAVKIANRRFDPFFSPKDGGFCSGNTINVSGSPYCDDFTKRNSSFFIHEMTHIWQYQTSPMNLGKKFTGELLKVKFNAKTYQKQAYNYLIEDGKTFNKYGLEQQAAMVQDYFALVFNHGMGISCRCDNKDMSREDKVQALEKILKPHFPLSKSSPKSTPKNFKPR